MGKKFYYNSCLLEKVSRDCDFRVGDKIRITSNKKRFKKNQKFHGGYNDSLDRFLGKVGSIYELAEDERGHSKGDLAVKFQGETGVLLINPNSAEKFFEALKVGDDVEFVIDENILAACQFVTKSYTNGDLRGLLNQVVVNNLY